MKRLGIVIAICVGCCVALVAAVASHDAEGKARSEPCEHCGFEVTDESGPYCCALFPIMVFTSGTFYYCDYFDPDCYAEPEAAYMVGDYDYPMECPYCEFGTAVGALPEFVGMPAAVKLAGSGDSTSHSDATAELLEGTLLAPAANTSCRPRLAGWLKLAAFGSEHYAAVIEVEFTRTATGRSATVGFTESRWIALEVERAPDDDVEVVDAVEPQQLAGGRAYRARFEPASGQSVSVLVLLAH